MKEIADILMKQLRMIGELSRASFEHGDVNNLSELTEAMNATVDMCLHVQGFATMQNKLGRDD